MAKLLSLLVLALAALWPALPAAAAEHPFVVIAGPGVAEHHLSREVVAQIFRRKQNYWANGARVQPVNLPPQHPLRRGFSQAVLGHLPEGMEDYWREMYFHGVLPPHVLASEEAVLLFVASTPGAIGYVASCPTEHKVTVLLVVGDLPNCAH